MSSYSYNPKNFKLKCLEGGFWQPPDEYCCFSFGQRSDFLVESKAKCGPTVHKDPRNMLTLHFVTPRTEEWNCIQHAAALKNCSPSISLPFIFRVQNYTRAPQLLDYVESQLHMHDKFEDQLCFGFHSMKHHNMDWASLLLNGVDPNACQESRYGIGAYFALNPNLCVKKYSKKFYSPVYEDLQDPANEPTIDTYTAVGMFLLYTGMRKTFNHLEQLRTIPDGYGAFQDEGKSQVCIQDYRSICPSYLLIYRTSIEKCAPNPNLKTYPEDAFEWRYKDPKTKLMVNYPSIYFKYDDDICSQMLNNLEEIQNYELDQSGLWDPYVNNPLDLACRLCEQEFGWRHASPLVLPNESVPYFERSCGRRLGYRPP